MQGMAIADIWPGYIAFGISLTLSAIFLTAYKKEVLRNTDRKLPEKPRGWIAEA